MDSLPDLLAGLRGDADGSSRELLFGDLVGRFQDMAFACAYALLGDFHLAEDAAQEAFVTAWRHLADLRQPEAFPGWFRRIVVSEAHRVLRRRRGREVALDGAAAGVGDDPARHVEQADLRDAVARAVRALPEAQRAAVALYYVGDRSVGEVAAFLGVPPSTVKNRLHSARRRLREGALALAGDELRAHRPSRDRGFADGVRERLLPFRSDLAYFEDRAEGLCRYHRAGLPAVLRVIRDFHPGLAGAAEAQVAGATFTMDDARLVLARQHGFGDWAAFAAHLAAVAGGRTVEPMADALGAMQAHDLPRLRACLDAHPDLVRRRGTNGHTLLNLAAACRDLDAARLLLSRGADPDAGSDRGWTPLHQAGYANQPRLAEALLAAGAAPDRSAYGDGGTPLVQALFWGHREAADVLARHGPAPANLRVAAGLGDMPLLRALFDARGRPLPAARAHREYYRPHRGFPDWTPSDDPQELLDEAFVYAARNGRHEAMAALLARGAGIDHDPYRGTALVWAAANGDVETVRWLLAAGAQPDHLSTFGGPDHGDGVTALHIAAQGGRLAVVRLLVEHGADAGIRDSLHGGTPADWAKHFQQPELAAYLAAPGAG